MTNRNGDSVARCERKNRARAARWYGLALLLVAVAALVVRLPPPGAVHGFLDVLAFPAAALLAAWFGGVGPGLLVGVLGVFASALLIFPPLGSLAVESHGDFAIMVAQAALGLGLSFSVGAIRHVRCRERIAAQAVARSEEKHRLLFERNPEPMAILDATTQQFLSVNRAAVDRFGYSKDELLAMRSFDLMFPEDVPLFMADIERTPPPDSHDIFEPHVWRYRKKNGPSIHVETSASRLALEGRECVLVLARDVTDRVRAMCAMRDAEEKWHALLESSSDCFLVVDRDDRIAFASHALGPWGPDRLRNHLVGDFVAPEEGADIRASMATVRRTRSAMRFEVRVRAADGSATTTHDVRSLPIKGHCDSSMVLLVLTDVSRRREQEEQLRAAKEAADEANRAKDRFIAALSHELRTPLTPVLAAATLAKTRYPEAADLLGVIDRNVEIERRLIDDLLDVSRLVSGKLSFEPQFVDVHSLVQRVITICKPEADPKDVRVDVDLEAMQPWVWADPLRMEQAIWNIVQNAIKFTPRHGNVAIESNNSPQGRIAVKVSNTGRGIPKDALGRIFLPFEQVREACGGRGLGLGLAITRGIVDAAGGKVTAESDGLESGASFTIELPVRAPVGPPEREVPSVVARAGHTRLLLVEDDTDTREALRDLLCEFEYEVEVADTKASALATFRDHQFDLVISDIGLPDGTGLDLLAELKALRSVRAIALSGFGMAEDVSRSRAAGFAAHLTKPISLVKLTAAIREVMS